MKSTFKLLCAMLIAVFCGQQARAQLSGTIAVPSTTYPTLDSVIRTLNIQGVGTGGVTINVTTAQNAPAGGYQLGSTVLNASTSSLKTITINGNNNTVTSNVGTGSADAMFSILGTDYVTVNGLALSDTNTLSATTQMEWGFSLVKLNAAAPFDGCQNDKINGCTITLKVGNASTIGIRGAHTQVASTTALATTSAVAADANSNNIFTANTISGCNTAIYLTGMSTASFYDYNNVIGGATSALGNTISIGGASATVYGVRSVNDTLLTIQNNQFSISSAQSALTYILYPGLGKGNLNIVNNTFNVSSTLTSVHTYVLYNYNVSSAGHQDANATFKFAGNTITGTNSSATSGYLYGMYNYYSTFYADSIYNNVVNNLKWGSATSTSYLYLFYNYYGSTQYIYANNNAITNITKTGSTSGGYIYGMYLYNYPATSGTVTMTNNLIQYINTNYYMYGLYAYGGSSGQTVFHKYNKIDNVVVNNSGYLYGHYGYYGITGSEIAYDTISNCRVTSGGMYAIYQGNATGTVHDNLVLNDSAATGTLYCLYHANGTSNIYNNRIIGSTLTGASGGIYGMYFSTVTTATNVYNNTIANFAAPAYSGTSLYGMYLSSSVNYNIYHNTIRQNITSTGANLGMAGIYYSSSITSLDLRNNIINVNVTPAGTGIVAALVRSSGTSGTVPTNFAVSSNSNIYYVPNIANAYIYAESYSTTPVNYYSLTNDAGFNTSCGLYKSFMAPRESASFIENNLVQVGTSLLYAPGGTSYAKSVGAATTSPAVTTDENGVTRNTPPDAGALQFTGTAIDASAPTIVYSALPATTYCLAAPSLTATITDISGVNTTTSAPRMYYKRKSDVDTFGTYPAANVAAFNGWKYVTATNSGSTFTFTPDYSKLTATPAAGDTLQYFIVAQDNNATPNVGSSGVAYRSGYCPSDVNLSVAAGPTSSSVVKSNYAILTQPALPGVTPATANVCQGKGVKLTAVPTAGSLMATLGTGTVVNSTSTYPTPYGNWYGSNHDQYLILASELTTQGLTAGNMTSLAFNLNTGYSYAALQNYVIQLGNTSATSMSSATLISTGLTSVYSNTSYTPSSAAGWTSVTFTTPFVWDGVSNVVVDVSFSNCSVCNGTSSCTTSYTNNGLVNQTNTSFVSALNFHADNNCTINSMAPSISGTTYSQRPNMQLNGTQKFNVNWSNIANLYKDSALTQPVSATDTNTVVYAAPSASATYAVKNVLGLCTSVSGTASSVSVLPVPTATTTPAATASFCGGSSATLTGSAASGMNYQWILGGNAISGATGSSYTASTTGTYTFKVTNATTGCSATSAPVIVSNTAPPAATATASGATTVCNGSVVTVNANTGSGLTYQWLKNGTAVSGATSATYGATTSGNYAVMVYNAGNCSTTSSAVPVTVNTINTTVTASGSTSICPGSTVTFSVPATSNQTYQWRLNGTAISGATASSYTAANGGTYSVKIYNSSFGCTDSSSGATVTVGSGPVSAITPAGTVGICSGTSTTLSYSPVTGVTYQWQLNGASIAGATNPTYTTTAGGNYTLLASTSPTCQTTSATTIVLVNPLPNVVTTPSGNATVCQNSTITLSVPAGTNYTYQWKQGGVNISGATGNTYTTSVPGNYAVRVINTLTTCRDTSVNVAVTQVAVPTATATAASALTICAGDSTILQANSGSGLSYQWQIGSNVIAGATDSVYKARIAGSYTVKVTNTGNCSTTSSALTVNVNPLPASTITYNSPLVFCQGGGVVLTAVDATGQTYQWLQNGTPVTGAVSSNYIVYQSGSYQIKVTSALGCSALSQMIPVTVNPLPNPVITKNGFTLSTGNFTSYQWYLNNTAIANGGHSQSITASQNGAYHVVVTDGNGCTNSSTVIFVNNVGVNNVAVAGDIKIFPNPTNGVVNIDAPVKVNISVRDLSGKEIVYAPGAQKVDITSVASGVYMMMITDTEGHLLKVEKVFKAQ